MTQLPLPQSLSGQASFARGGALLALLACLVLIPAFANNGAYVAMVVSLPVTLVVLYNWRWFSEQDWTFPAVFAAAYVILAVMTVLPGRPAGSAIHAFDFIPLIFAIGLYVGLSKVDREKLLMIMAYGCLIGAGLSCAVGAYFVFGTAAHRAHGVAGSSIYYANVTLLLGFLALAPLFSDGRWRWPLALAPIFAIAAGLMSGSRSIIPVGAALTIVLLVHLFLSRKKRAGAMSWRPALILAAILVASTTGFLLFDGYQTQRIVGTFAQIPSLLRGDSLTDINITVRFDFYQSGIRIFLEKPLTGYGWLQAFETAAPYMELYDPSRDPEGMVRHLHNDMIQFAAAFGIPGIVAYFLMILAPVIAWLWGTSRKAGYGSYSVFAVAAGCLAMGLTDTNFIFEAPKVMFCFTAAGAAALACHRSQEQT